MSLLHITRGLLSLEFGFLVNSLDADQYKLVLSYSSDLWNKDDLSRDMLYAICLSILLKE